MGMILSTVQETHAICLALPFDGHVKCCNSQPLSKVLLFSFIKWILSLWHWLQVLLMRSNEMTQIYLANWKKKDNLKSNSPSLITKFYKTHYQGMKSVSTFANTDNDIYLGGKLGTLKLIYTNFMLHSSY